MGNKKGKRENGYTKKKKRIMESRKRKEMKLKMLV